MIPYNIVETNYCGRVTLRRSLGKVSGLCSVQRNQEPRNKNSKKTTKPEQITILFKHTVVF